MGLRACADRELTALPAAYRRISSPSPGLRYVFLFQGTASSSTDPP